MKNFTTGIHRTVSHYIKMIIRNSLGLKFTASFLIFGLLIGYTVFIILSVIQTRGFVEDTAGIVQAWLIESSEAGGITEFSDLIDRGDTGFSKLISYLKDRHADKLGIRAINIYYSDPEQDEWYAIDSGEGYIFRRNAVPAERYEILDKAEKDRIWSSSGLFKSDDDVSGIIFNITRPSDKNTYLLEIKASRESVLTLIKYHTVKFMIFAISLLFISLTLGHLFARRLTKPIIDITEGAEKIAEGRYDQRFEITRGDEIGRLVNSLNLMAGNIENNITEIRQRAEEKENILLGIMLALSRAIDAKSQWTLGHSERVTEIAELIGAELGISDEEHKELRVAALLHDIGKIAVPEVILDKKEKLTDQEFETIKRHPAAGAEIISDIPSYENILTGILSHHERFDGTGYPSGIKGERIPLKGRIIAVADVYDALTADRPYRKGMLPEEAFAFIKENSGAMFDPRVVKAFENVFNETGHTFRK